MAWQETASGTLEPGAGPRPPPGLPASPASAGTVCWGVGGGSSSRGDGVRRVGACRRDQALSEAEGRMCLQEVAVLAGGRREGRRGCLGAAWRRLWAERLTEHQAQTSGDPSEPSLWPQWGSRPSSRPQFSEEETKAQSAQWPAGRPQPAPCELCSLEQPSWADTRATPGSGRAGPIYLTHPSSGPSDPRGREASRGGADGPSKHCLLWGGPQ